MNGNWSCLKRLIPELLFRYTWDHLWAKISDQFFWSVVGLKVIPLNYSVEHKSLAQTQRHTRVIGDEFGNFPILRHSKGGGGGRELLGSDTYFKHSAQGKIIIYYFLCSLHCCLAQILQNESVVLLAKFKGNSSIKPKSGHTIFIIWKP